MALHNELGREGEQAAADYLERNGYIIRDRNWHRGHLELDIIAAKDNTLVVVEVKTRRDTLFAEPEDAVTPQKIRRIVKATDTYIKMHQLDVPVRFDIITVVGKPGQFHLEHLKEAFLPPLF